MPNYPVHPDIHDLADLLAESAPLAVRNEMRERLAVAFQHTYEDWWGDVETEIARDIQNEVRLRDKDRAGQ